MQKTASNAKHRSVVWKKPWHWRWCGKLQGRNALEKCSTQWPDPKLKVNWIRMPDVALQLGEKELPGGGRGEASKVCLSEVLVTKENMVWMAIMVPQVACCACTGRSCVMSPITDEQVETIDCKKLVETHSVGSSASLETKGLDASVLANHKRQWGVISDAKRSTSALPNR